MCHMETQSLGPNDGTLPWRMLRLVYLDNISFGGRITDLLDIVEVGQAFKQESMGKKYDDFLTSMEVHGLKQDEIAGMKSLITQHKENSLRNLSATIIASALVLSHSHLDHSLNLLLMVSVYSNWESWAARILNGDKARYSLAEALQFDLKKEKNRARLAFLKNLKQKSILERNRTLLTKVGVFAAASSEKRIAEAALASFDAARHGVVHANELVREDFTESAPQDFRSIFSHVENLCQSVCEFCEYDWDNLTDPTFEEEHVEQ